MIGTAQPGAARGRRRGIALAAVIVCTVAGCGGAELPKRAKVTGIVTLDGKPLTYGRVQFVPDRAQGNQGPIAVGVIDETGRYRLSTDRELDGDDGAVLGFHRVCVEATPPPQDIADSPRSPIPAQYNRPETSQLTAEVKDVDVNDIPFALRSN
jgi:hypothetical protein